MQFFIAGFRASRTTAVAIHAAIVATLVACAAHDTLPPPAVLSAEAYTARRLDDPALNAFIGQIAGKRTTDRWGIDELTLAAFYYSPALDLARSEWAETKARQTTAGQRPNPEITLTPTRVSQLHPWILGLGVNLPVETAGKRELRMQQAVHLASAAEYRVGSTAWTVRGKVVATLIAYAAATESETLLRAQAAAQKAVIDVFSARAAQGQLPSVTASQAAIAYRETLLNAQDAVQQAAEARAQLASTIGVSVTALDGIPLDTDALIRSAAASVPSLGASLLQHTELLAALAEYAAAHSALQVEIAKRVPDISIGPGYEWNPAGDRFTLGLSITLPLFHHNQGPIAEAAARRQQAADRFNVLQAEIIGHIESAEAGFTAAQDKLASADRLLAAQRDKVKLLRAQLRAGEASRLPLLLAQSEVSAAERARFGALTDVLKSRAALEAASQVMQFGSRFDTGLSRQAPREERR